MYPNIFLGGPRQRRHATVFYRNHFHLAVLALGTIAVLQCNPASAQTAPDGTAAGSSLKEVTVTGNPIGTDEVIAPASSLSGNALILRRATTLGETLDKTPGISSSYFGPNASRPIIRGLDGDRIRILSNGGAAIDASALSYDHAVASDPISVERIDVLRGPGALLYGGSAVGGVVNVIDNRIPREALFDEKGGITGKLNLGTSTGNNGKEAGSLLEAGNNLYALHADAFSRETGNVGVPVTLACANGGPASQICNSASKSRGGAIGGSVFFEHGYLGLSKGTYRSNYGTVAEDTVTIDMKSNRTALEGELRDLAGPIQSIKGKYSQTDYAHTEFEGSTPGTVFKNKGSDFRLEAKHAKFWGLDGLIGFQSESTRFSADGKEAFAPYSNTSQNAAFAYEEYATSWGRLSFGGRVDSVKVESYGNPLVAAFTPGSRSFTPHSYALGGLWNVLPGWQLTSNLAYTERAPKDYELYAFGPHVATNAWETGDATLGKEKSTSIDLGANWKSGAHTFTANVYRHNFSNYIGLLPTGRNFGQKDRALNPPDVNGDGVDDNNLDNKILAEYAYSGVRARFTGFEASGNIRLFEGVSKLDLGLRTDMVTATNLTNGEPLPRIAPLRVGATLQWGRGPWGSSFGFDYSAAQNRVAPGQRATDAFTLWNAAATYALKFGAVNTLLYVKLDNITNQLAYSASSVLTTTAFPKAPLPGRSLKVGLQASF
jgi:iron complex outermembrane receptor protein